MAAFLALLSSAPYAQTAGVIPADELPTIEVGEIDEIQGIIEQEPLPEATASVPPSPPSSEPNFERLFQGQAEGKQHNTARIRILTFSTNQLDDRTLQVGVPLVFEDLQFVLQGCRANVNNIPDHDMAWLDIFSTSTPQSANMPEVTRESTATTVIADTSLLLSGWLLSQYTDAHTLEHPKYDVRLLHCQS